MPAKVRIERLTAPGEGVEAWIDLARRHPKSTIKVGILSGTGEHPNASHGQTMAEVGWWNEFGTTRIPERPFLRTGLREQNDKYRLILKKGLKKILVGESTDTKILALLGAVAVSDVQAKIVAVNSPPNADLTQEKKGSSSPLIDTGALRQHINWAEVQVMHA